ncbi:class I SAM-dependent methyltransferase, partial [Myxococcota bacterium]|nr:class I SAM-dependent methyltransferase [Myxococcota bacterium]
VEGQNSKERDDIQRRLKEFYGPFRAIRSESRTLYSYFALIEKKEQNDKGQYFRTLRHLTDGNELSKQDTAILSDILYLGQKQLDLIENEGGAVTNSNLLELLGMLGAHIRALLLAAKSKLDGLGVQLEGLVFPLEVDGAIESEVMKLQDRYQQLLRVDVHSKVTKVIKDTQRETIESYNRDWGKYFRDTAYLDLSHVYQVFRKHIPRGGKILDAGCGVGRDTRYFIQHGYRVVAFDASEKMVELCSQYPFGYCLHHAFDDLERIEEFDGVWACASLLHLQLIDLKDALSRLVNSLTPDGVLYFSLKSMECGCQYESQNGKTYYFYDKNLIDSFVQNDLMLDQIDIWKTESKKKSDGREWDNYLYKKPKISVKE